MGPVRYRCDACGNLTRFDVTATRSTRAFHHYSLGGDLTVEDEVLLAETVDEVSCRWCGHGRAVEVLGTEPPPGPGTPAVEPEARPGPGVLGVAPAEPAPPPAQQAPSQQAPSQQAPSQQAPVA